MTEADWAPTTLSFYHNSPSVTRGWAVTCWYKDLKAKINVTFLHRGFSFKEVDLSTWSFGGGTL